MSIKDTFKKREVTYRQELVDNDIILSVRHLKQFFKFGHGKNSFKTKAVHDVSFDVKKGECFGLVGESGCGKTTTGRSLIRLYNITSGSVYFKGYRISAGRRWNDKEIKWTRIKNNKKIRELYAQEDEEIQAIRAATDAKSKDLNAKRKEEDKIINRRVDPSITDESDINDKHSEIKVKYQTLVSEGKKSADELISQVRAKYSNMRREIKAQTEAVVKEQREAIAQIKYDNRHVDKKVMSKMQMIFQDPVDSLDPRMTVEDIITEGLIIQGQRNKFANSLKVAESLEKVGLIPEYASRYPHEFSGGQRQRIGIARALVMNPEFLICDEPISALDVSIRAQIINLLNNLKEEMGLTILFIAHDLSVVKYFCDRIAVMYYGEIVELATSEELFKHPLHPYTNALLSAIPKPDPLTEKSRQRLIYNPLKEHDYSVEKPKLTEILPGHFVLANTEEIEKYKLKIKEQGE